MFFSTPIPAFLENWGGPCSAHVTSYVHIGKTFQLQITKDAEIIAAVRNGANISPYSAVTILQDSIIFRGRDVIPVTPPIPDMPVHIFERDRKPQECIYYELSKASWVYHAKEITTISPASARDLLAAGIPNATPTAVDRIIPDRDRL